MIRRVAMPDVAMRVAVVVRMVVMMMVVVGHGALRRFVSTPWL
jgi:hypothetical protein